jgi:2-polyprenyl-6-methoxyphenol hydroxylase-like FAD-dependent oxidoreductase
VLAEIAIAVGFFDQGVGGGIAGLTLATALHAQGFEVDLIERNPGKIELIAWRSRSISPLSLSETQSG